jgi:cytochrome c biogenesis protein ResB
MKSLALLLIGLVGCTTTPFSRVEVKYKEKYIEVHEESLKRIPYESLIPRNAVPMEETPVPNSISYRRTP